MHLSVATTTLSNITIHRALSRGCEGIHEIVLVVDGIVILPSRAPGIPPCSPESESSRHSILDSIHADRYTHKFATYCRCQFMTSHMLSYSARPGFQVLPEFPSHVIYMNGQHVIFSISRIG